MARAKRARTTRPRFKGGFEPKVYDKLTSVLPVESVEYEAENLPYTSEHLYKPDFKIQTKSGKTIYIESKGYFKYPDRVKMLSVIRCHPDKDIRILFQRNNSISKKTKYIDWCEKHNIICAVGEVPEGWLE